jgi:hypothetical protein
MPRMRHVRGLEEACGVGGVGQSLVAFAQSHRRERDARGLTQARERRAFVREPTLQRPRRHAERGRAGGEAERRLRVQRREGVEERAERAVAVAFAVGRRRGVGPARREPVEAFLDGAKSAYLPILRVLEPHLGPAALIVADNTEMPGARPLLDYADAPGSGYARAALSTMALGAAHPCTLLMRAH